MTVIVSTLIIPCGIYVCHFKNIQNKQFITHLVLTHLRKVSSRPKSIKEGRLLTHDKLMRVVDLISKLAFLNILWLLFTALGLFVFGFFPATVAMFATIRSFMREDISIPLFQTFWSHFKANFVRSLSYGLLTTVIIMIGAVSVYFYFFKFNVTVSLPSLCTR